MSGGNLDEVFERIGGFGKAQKKIYYLMNLVHIPTGFHTMILTFIAIDPNWTCGNKQKDCFQFDLGKCEPQFDPTVSSIIAEVGLYTIDSFFCYLWLQFLCMYIVHHVLFMMYYFPFQWNLICGESLLSKISQSVYFVGAMLGAWIFGTVSDRFGRRKTYFISVALSAASGLGYSLAPNYYIFLLFRFLVALNLAGVILSSFVLSMEIVGAEDRTYAGLMTSGIFGFSYPLLAGLAYVIPNWRLIGVVSSIALLPLLLLWRSVVRDYVCCSLHEHFS